MEGRILLYLVVYRAITRMIAIVNIDTEHSHLSIFFLSALCVNPLQLRPNLDVVLYIQN